ncbi:MAG: ferric reductase-like transmembrane domain-containing protein [Arenibacterium sp.]
MTLLLLQPLQVGGKLPGLPPKRGRRTHRWIGILLIGSVLVHVIGLWLTSPPDVIDALLLRSPTPFSLWGVLAMWALFAAALLGALRRRLRLRWRQWRFAHTFLGILVVAGSIAHALLIEGTMETTSKILLCILVLAATLKTYIDLRVWSRGTGPHV